MVFSRGYMAAIGNAFVVVVWRHRFTWCCWRLAVQFQVGFGQPTYFFFLFSLFYWLSLGWGWMEALNKSYIIYPAMMSVAFSYATFGASL
jgi:hypothetical protein